MCRFEPGIHIGHGEIPVAAMTEETAKVRAERALNNRSLPAGVTLYLKCGDLAYLFSFSSSGTKNASGWIGPAKVIDPTHIDKGTFTVRHVHRPIDVKIGDQRRHMTFRVCLATIHSHMDPHVQAWNDVRTYIDSHRTDGEIELLGYYKTKTGRTRTPQTLGHRDFLCLGSPVCGESLTFK